MNYDKLNNDSSIIIRKWTEKDIAIVSQMEQQCFESPWTKEMFLQEWKNDQSQYILLEDINGIQAYAGMWLVLDEAHIINVAVLPRARRNGYGQCIMESLLDHAVNQGIKAVTLEVRQSNLSAQNLYYKLGFKLEGVRPKYYNNTEDAFILWKKY